MHHSFRSLCLVITMCIVACTNVGDKPATSGVLAEEANVQPDINNTYKDPDLDPEMWAERFTGESREVFAQRNKVLAALKLQSGDRIADIGAGGGLYVKLFAEAIGPEGLVYAVDIAQPFLDFIQENARADNLENVKTVLGEDKTSNLPDASVDVIFHSDTYHHFEYPRTMVQDLSRALVDGGEMFVLDFERIEGFSSEVTLNHVRADKEVVISEIESAGFILVEEIDLPELKENFLLRFRKR